MLSHKLQIIAILCSLPTGVNFEAHVYPCAKCKCASRDCSLKMRARKMCVMYTCAYKWARGINCLLVDKYVM